MEVDFHYGEVMNFKRDADGNSVKNNARTKKEKHKGSYLTFMEIKMTVVPGNKSNRTDVKEKKSRKIRQVKRQKESKVKSKMTNKKVTIVENASD